VIAETLKHYSEALDLPRAGIAEVWPMLDVHAVLNYLDSRPTYHGHVKGASVAAHQPGNSTCWAPEDVLRAPHFFEFALKQTSIVRKYLGQEPLLYSVNAFTTYPIDGPMNPDIQEWHRDKDDVRFVALFVYLTDVLIPEDGAHLFKLETHRTTEDGPVETMLGSAGTAFLADTRGLHMGIRPTIRPRTMVWARWGVSDPPASYVWDKQAPVDKAVLGARYPADKTLQESIRLVVQ
jgi:hypothetical protein